VTAFARASSIDSAANQALRDRGVRVVLADLDGPKKELVKLLKDVDTVICSVIFNKMDVQVPLAEAAKEAGVKRFVPCFWGTPAPRGVQKLYDEVRILFTLMWKLIGSVKFAD
jgi:uncharacterized protein YbjT (DUF2867 family)